MHQIELKIEQEKLDYDEFYYVYPTKNVFLSFIYCVISLMYFSYERIFHKTKYRNCTYVNSKIFKILKTQLVL